MSLQDASQTSRRPLLRVAAGIDALLLAEFAAVGTRSTNTLSCQRRAPLARPHVTRPQVLPLRYPYKGCTDPLHQHALSAHVRTYLRSYLRNTRTYVTTCMGAYVDFVCEHP